MKIRNVLLIALASVSFGAFAQSDAEVVCKGQVVSAEQVIVGETDAAQCNYGAYLVKTPAATETVCSQSPIPPGYVITSAGTNAACGEPAGQSKVITRM
ncbi:MAG: hypothetical protein LBL59_07925 [Xanthomonadaceae bacterium]|jgi:hypothetical protein|nr:hypothetical protein [Xanthomonadaceae bacterium]